MDRKMASLALVLFLLALFGGHAVAQEEPLPGDPPPLGDGEEPPLDWTRCSCGANLQYSLDCSGCSSFVCYQCHKANDQRVAEQGIDESYLCQTCIETFPYCFTGCGKRMCRSTPSETDLLAQLFPDVFCSHYFGQPHVHCCDCAVNRGGVDLLLGYCLSTWCPRCNDWTLMCQCPDCINCASEPWHCANCGMCSGCGQYSAPFPRPALEYLWVCLDCGVPFNNYFQYEQHECTDPPPLETWVCAVCGYEALSPEDLAAHTCTSNPPQTGGTCPLCDMWVYDLDMHMLMMH